MSEALGSVPRAAEAPVVLVGLDACEKDLLLRWAGEGVLPTLAGLLRTGVSGIVRNATALHGGSAWVSFATGKTPARHGRFCRQQAPLGAYLDRDHTPADVDGEAFWSVLAAAGRRVVVLDVPHTKPSAGVNGVEIVDWITHDPHFIRPSVQPGNLARDLEARCPAPAIDSCQTFTDLHARLPEFCAIHRERLEGKLTASLYCLGREPWDFFATVFGEGHCVGHRCWHIHDPRHPVHDVSLRAQHGDPVRDIYVALDAAVGRLLEHVPPEATVIVLASHGMGPVYVAENAILDDLLLRIDGTPARTQGALFRWLKRRWYALPPFVRESAALGRVRGRLLSRLHDAMLVPDRKARRFFAIPNDRYAGAVRVNLKGREQHGVVEPADYEAVCADIRDALLELVDTDTHEPFVVEASLARECYEGPHRDELPDVAVEWRRTHPVRAISSARLGTTRLPPIADRTGDHRNEGLIVAVGPHLAHRCLDVPVAIEDLAPTIAELNGVTLEGADGRAIEALLRSEAARGSA